MKKLYTTYKYKKKNTRRAKERLKRKLISKEKQKEKRRRISGKDFIEERNKKRRRKSKIKIRNHHDTIKPTAYPPNDLRLIENTDECLTFFRKLRSNDYLSKRRYLQFVIMSLKDVAQIDYGAISILTAISDDLKFRNIILKGDFPDNPECKQFVIDSGYLSHMFDEHGNTFPKTEKSELIFFEKGRGKLSLNENIAISNTVKNVVRHLTGELNQCLAVKTIVLEICGNSIEWGGTENKQWLLGVQYLPDKVVFTVTDVGKGILETLHRKFGKTLTDIFTRKSNSEILLGAFEQKYGSSTREVNRNKGLPSVKYNFEQNTIRQLIVLSNNVILHFDDVNKSQTFDKGKSRFHGTFYQWEMTSECLNNISID